MDRLVTKYRIWITAAVVAHTLWTSAAPAMVYPIYIDQWNLSYTQTMLVFGTYPIVVGVLLLLSNFALQRFSREQLVSIGLGASTLGVFLFAIGDSLAWLLVGRVFMGVGVGLSAGYSAAELIELSPNKQRAGTITIAAQSVGFSASFIAGGAFVEFTVQPAHYPFVFLFIVLLAVFALYILTTNSPPQYPQAKSGQDESNISKPLLALLILTVTTAYMHGVTYTALGATVAKQLLASTNSLLNGFVLGFFAISIGAGAFFARKFDGFPAIRIGAVFSIFGMALLVAAANQQSIFLYGASSFSSGIGYALKFSGSISIINLKSTEKNNSKTINTILVFAYLFTGFASIAVGKISEYFDVSSAIYFITLSVSIMSLLVIYISFKRSISSTTNNPHGD